MYIGKCEAKAEESLGSTYIPTQKNHQTRSSTILLNKNGAPEVIVVVFYTICSGIVELVRLDVFIFGNLKLLGKS